MTTDMVNHPATRPTPEGGAMSLVQIRDEYGWVTARNGARVATHIAGEGDYYGTITGTRGDLLVVKFDRLSVPQVIGPEQVTYVEEAPDDRWP